ncbi:MAG: TolC family protein [Cryobacterium sp.]|nr:TolC family protein [Oligoflexia bacterium]
MIYGSMLLVLSLCYPSAVFAASQELEDPVQRTGPAALPWETIELKDSKNVADLPLILKSIETHFPLTRIAEKQIEIAEGREMAARGSFDFRLQLQAGFLAETYDQKILDGSLIKQIPGTPLEIYGGWRQGRGNFRPYEGKSLTGAEGEYRGGFKIPLLRDFLSDPARTRASTSKLLLASEKENVKFRILDIKRIASDRYWEWIGSYFKLEATFKLYGLAGERLSQIKKRVKAGGAALIEVVEVERMIAQRKAQLIEAERLYQKSALELALYYRDESGNPQTSMSIRNGFELGATISDETPVSENKTAITEQALAMRGDIGALEKQEEAANIEMELSKNQTLPKLDAQLEYAFDKGLPKDGEKELRGMLTLTFPLENRESRGNLMAAQARMEQVRLTKNYLNDQVKQDILNLRSALSASHNRAKILLLDRTLSEKLALAERQKFQNGHSSLLFVNLREQTANDSAIKAMDAVVEFQKIKVVYQVSRGLDPI